MKSTVAIAAFLLLLVSSCGETPSEKKPQQPTAQNSAVAKNSEHILSEAYEEQRSVHYFDPNVLVYDRMILRVELNQKDQLFVNGAPASYDVLLQEMHNFYQANRDLGPELTKLKKDDPYYNLGRYPYFNYFDKAQFKTYLDRLEVMAKTDEMAQQHYINHKNRFDSFEAVPDSTVLPFIEFGALILIEHHEFASPEKIEALERKVADNIYALRDAMAQQEFLNSYHKIRENAAKKNVQANYQLVCLQEMVPAYIMKRQAKKMNTIVEKEPLQLPAPPPPAVEEIEEKENTEE